MSMDFENEDYEEVKVENCEDIESSRKFEQKNTKPGGGGPEKMNDPELIEALETVFQSAHDHFMVSMIEETLKNKMINKGDFIENNNLIIEEEESKEESVVNDVEIFETREKLPFFKDSRIKISIWAIIKDSIGKDLSKITVPVYFNGPLSLLQQYASSTEYNQILEDAS